LGQRLELTWWNKGKALIPTSTGRYGYTWVEEADPRACQTHFLIDDGHVGDLADGGLHDNLMVAGESGDVLEALTRVPELADRYVGKVKCVYIDPPFNTEATFNHYEDNLEHSVWLGLMHHRLVMLQELLRDDGSIWVHLNYAENHRMRLLLDEVFGAKNFRAEVVWEKADSPRRGDGFSVDQDVILVYAKTSACEFNKTARTAADNARFANPDGDPNGPWWDGDPTANHGDGHGGMCYAIQSPVTGEMLRPSHGANWRYGQKRILESLREWAPYRLENLHDEEWRAENEGIDISKVKKDVCALVLDVSLEDARRQVELRREQGAWPEYIVRRSGGLGRKSYIPPTGNNPRTWWTNKEVGHNREAKSEIKALFPRRTPFDTPKPERLLKRVIEIASNPGDIVVDVFGGSGTTAAVAHKLGRRWVTCELLEKNVTTFMRPRLEKVVDGDPGGISIQVSYAAADELPGKTTLAEAQVFNTVLSRIAKNAKDRGEPIDKTLLRTLRQETAVTSVKERVWDGGGGFDMAHLSPEWVTVDADHGMVTIAELALNDRELLARSVAAHRGYRWEGDGIIDGRKGDDFLAVTAGIVSADWLAPYAERLVANQTLTVACAGATEDATEWLDTHYPGSRILRLPGDLFTFDASVGGL